MSSFPNTYFQLHTLTYAYTHICMIWNADCDKFTYILSICSCWHFTFTQTHSHKYTHTHKNKHNDCWLHSCYWLSCQHKLIAQRERVRIFECVSLYWYRMCIYDGRWWKMRLNDLGNVKNHQKQSLFVSSNKSKILSLIHV